MHISSYAKILGEKLFHTWEIPQSGSKAEDGGIERAKVGDNNGRATHDARKLPGPKDEVALFSSAKLTYSDLRYCC